MNWKCFFGKHEWVMTALQKCHYTMISGDVTVILWKCKKCGKRIDENVNGHWTEEQLFGKKQ